MLCFAYGSNMCIGRLRIRVPSCRKLFVAKLKGYALHFHKRSKDGSGKADAVKTGIETDEAWGVVFYIDDSEENKLDKAEGLNRGYGKREEDVFDNKDVPHKAWMYYAEENAIDSTLKPYSWYKRFVVEGARQHGLPEWYIAGLENVEFVEDSDSNRDAENRTIQC